MNKGMIVLGLLLVVGLSFAGVGPWQYDWQEHVSWRYACDYWMGEDQYSAAFYYMQPYASPTELMYMEYYQDVVKYWELFGTDGDYGMMDEYYATPFRADMAGYNSANSLFRSIFNAAYREYMAATGDPSFVARDYLAGARASYVHCVSSTPWPTD
jgi:hypothetical protein